MVLLRLFCYKNCKESFFGELLEKRSQKEIGFCELTSPDVISQIMTALPAVLLFKISIACVKWQETVCGNFQCKRILCSRRKRRQCLWIKCVLYPSPVVIS